MKLTANNISFTYKNGTFALKNISFRTQEGDMLAIVGQNGSGKSTLLKCINRILKINMGNILVGNQPLCSFSMQKLSRIIAYVPQKEENISGANVFDSVLLGRKPYIQQAPTIQDLDIVGNILARLELETVAMSNLKSLSGGQQQRVFIARALAQEPQILLLDEPIANLDINKQMKVMRLLQEFTTEGMTIILTIHDINIAARFCNKVLMLKQGELFASGRQSVYTPENIQTLYDTQVDVLHHHNNIYIIPQ